MYKRSYESSKARKGYAFELKVSTLVGLRLYLAGEPFYLADHFEKIDKFDDLVFSCSCAGVWRVCFVQLKHRDFEDSDFIFTNLGCSKDYALSKYLKEFNAIKKRFSNASEKDEIFKHGLDNATMVLFTNAKADKDTERNSRTGRSYDGAVSVLLTKGIAHQLLAVPSGTFEASSSGQKPKGQSIGPLVKKLEELGEGEQEFLDHLWLCTGHCNQAELDEPIKETLKEALVFSSNRCRPEGQRVLKEVFQSTIVLDYDTLLLQLYDRVLQFQEKKHADFMTGEVVEQILAAVCLETLAASRCSPKSVFTDTYLEGVEGRAIEVRCQVPDTLVLAREAVLQCTSATRPVLLTLNELDCLETLVTAWWNSSEGRSLVVDCGGAAVTPRVSYLCSLLRSKSSHRIILLTTADSALSSEWSKVDFKCSFTDLSDESRTKVLESWVSFQGVRATVRQVLNISTLKEKHLALLYAGHELSVGAALNTPVELYVPRKVESHWLKPNQWQRALTQPVFAVTGATRDQLERDLSPPRGCIVSASSLREDSCVDSVRLVVLEDPSELKEVRRLLGAVHWLSKEGDRYRWRGCNSVNIYLSHFIESEPIEPTEIADRVVVLSGKPGSGKSSAMWQLAIELKAKQADMWVIVVPLNDFTQHLDDWASTPDAMEEILRKAAGVDDEDCAAQQALHYAVTHSHKLIVLVDGFDEICPDYTTQCCEFLTLLTQSSAKVWLTTRHVTRDIAQVCTGVSLCTLAPLSQTDHQLFLNNYFTEKYPAAPKDKQDLFVKKLMALVKASLKSETNQVVGVALQIRMVAEVFETNFDGYISGNRMSLPQHINIFTLMEKFVNKKLDIWMQEKIKLEPSNVGARRIIKQTSDAHKVNLIKMSVGSLVPKEYLVKSHANMREEAMSFRSDIETGNIKCGVVNRINSDGLPLFTHRLFGEYFTALYLSDHFQDFEAFFFKEMYQHGSAFEFTRHMFDRIVSQGHATHTAVYNADTAAYRENWNKIKALSDVDKGGRTVLHAAVLQGHDNESFVRSLDHMGKTFQEIKDTVLKWTAGRYMWALAPPRGECRNMKPVDSSTDPDGQQQSEQDVSVDYVALTSRCSEEESTSCKTEATSNSRAQQDCLKWVAYR